MIKKTKEGESHTTSYIPEPFCEVGRVLKLRNEGGEWDDGWVVKSAGERRSHLEVNEHSQHYKHQRKASDI